MHKLPEEAPLLVYYFLTLFLSNYKLWLIFIHFLDHINLLSIGAHLLTHFVRLLVCLALPLLRCGRFAAHFVRSLFALASLTLCTPFACALHSLHSRFALPSVTLGAHFVRTIALPSVAQSSSLRFALGART